MNVIGLEFCDAGLHTATDGESGPSIIDLGGENGWPAVACQLSDGLQFGPEAESVLFVRPRAVSHSFLENFSHESSELAGERGVPLSHSQLAFYFLRDYVERLSNRIGPADKIAIAVPGRYLKDAATEAQSIGLLLGMVSELKLPLVRIVDMACAAVGGPAAREFPRGSPIVHVDVHLHASELSLLLQESRMARSRYHHIPQAGYAQILRQIKNAMGNRFLRHTAFDIHEDRRLEQAFYQQTRDFLIGPGRLEKEFIYQINTGRRSYQMPATRPQLATDLQGINQTLASEISELVQEENLSPGACVISLSDRASRLDGLEARLRAAGFGRIVRLRPGAAAMGAAALAAESAQVDDLTEVPVDTAVPLVSTSPHELPVEALLVRPAVTDGRPIPSHVILDGIGHPIGENGLVIGTRHTHAEIDVSLPPEFDAVGDYSVRIFREGPRLRLELPTGDTSGPALVAAGDRLSLQGGGHCAEVLFAYCPGQNGTSNRR